MRDLVIKAKEHQRRWRRPDNKINLPVKIFSDRMYGLDLIKVFDLKDCKRRFIWHHLKKIQEYS